MDDQPRARYQTEHESATRHEATAVMDGAQKCSDCGAALSGLRVHSRGGDSELWETGSPVFVVDGYADRREPDQWTYCAGKRWPGVVQKPVPL